MIFWNGDGFEKASQRKNSIMNFKNSDNAVKASFQTKLTRSKTMTRHHDETSWQKILKAS